MDLKVSIVVRSYNRVAALCELLTRLLSQRHDSFEVVIVEQSTKVSPEEQERLDEIAKDSRIRLLEYPPLGGARARNVGVEASRGEIILMIDDDDLPEGDDWISAHEANYEDPNCMGVTGRQKYSEDDDENPYLFEWLAYHRCQRFSPLLKLPWVYARQTRRKVGIGNVTGGNGSIRRAVFERFGGWDEDTKIEDEASFGYRVGKYKREEEYFVFDPNAVLLRGFNIPGGLDKRYLTAGMYYERFMEYILNIIGRYFPLRVKLLYPLYILAATVWSISWIWDVSQRYTTFPGRIWGSIALLPMVPYHTVRSLIRRARTKATSTASDTPSHITLPFPSN